MKSRTSSPLPTNTNNYQHHQPQFSCQLGLPTASAAIYAVDAWASANVAAAEVAVVATTSAMAAVVAAASVDRASVAGVAVPLGIATIARAVWAHAVGAKVHDGLATVGAVDKWHKSSTHLVPSSSQTCETGVSPLFAITHDGFPPCCQ